MAQNSLDLINAVIDKQSFVEILSLVKGKSSLGEASGEGVTSGFCTVNDIPVALFGILGNVLQGSIGKKGAKKISIIVENAVKSSLPIVGFIDSAGARFAEGIKAMEGYSDIISAFKSAYKKVPIILVVNSKCYGMLSYLLDKCNYCICFNDSSIATLSPLLLASNTNKDLNEVANSKIHSQSSGIVSSVVNDTSQLKTQIAQFLDLLSNREKESLDDPNRACQELLSLAQNQNVSGNYDGYKIINSIFDTNSFLEIKKEYAKSVITGLARLDGTTVGIVAQNSKEGRIDSISATKITSMLKTCTDFKIPVINIVNSIGAVNDLENENTTLISNIADMMFKYLDCPLKIALITANAVGLGYVAFASKHTIDYTIAWENASIGMLTDEACASLLFSDVIANSPNIEKAQEELKNSYGQNNSIASVVASEGYIDNVIKPVFSRQYLITAVRAFYKKEQ